MAGIAREVGTPILALLAAFPDARRDAKLTLQVYAEAMRKVPPREIQAAIDRAIRECKYFPAVAELLEFIEAGKRERLAATTRPGDDGGPPFISWSSKGEGLRREGEDSATMLWRLRVRGFHKLRFWSDAYSSPKPTEPGCQAPAHILREFGFTPIAAPPRPKRADDLPAEQRERAQVVADRRVGDAPAEVIVFDEASDHPADAWERYSDTAKAPPVTSEGAEDGDVIV